MLVALCGEKGSPGVTTSALALASVWPAPAVLVEADLGGGDLAIRLRSGGSALPESPTVLSVATAARSNLDPDVLGRYAHHLTNNVSAVPGAIMREQMAAVRDWSPLALALARSESAVFVDLGHLHSASKVLEVAAYADLVVTVARPDATSVIRLRERLPRLATDLGALRGVPPRFFPLLVTESRHGDGDVSDLRSLLAETAAKPFIVGASYLAHDPAAVRRLETGDDPGGRLARTELLRTARSTVARLVGLLDSTRPGETAHEASGSRR
jgi:hypothetical protein